MRLLIVGHPNSGKTKLAEKLSDATGIEFISYYPMLEANPDCSEESLLAVLTDNKPYCIMVDFPMDLVTFDYLVYVLSPNMQRPVEIDRLKTMFPVIEVLNSYGSGYVFSKAVIQLYRLGAKPVVDYLTKVRLTKRQRKMPQLEQDEIHQIMGHTISVPSV